MRIAMLLHKSVEFDSRVRREASALAASGHRVCVLELAEIDAASTMLEGFTRRSVLSVARLRSPLPFGLHRLAFLLCFVREIVRVRPDVVHAHDAAMLLPGVVGAWIVGARLVYDSHELATSVPYRERGWAWLVGAIERVALPRCAAVITVSDGIAERLSDRYRLPVMPTVVRNVSGLSTSGANGLRRSLSIGEDVPLVLHQGAPAPFRGCETLIEAAVALEDVRVVFLGDATSGYGEQLQALIRIRGLADRVRLLPSVPVDDLLAHTAEADVGVTLLEDTCENHRLALPNKLFEYIAAGVPVIASALPEMERIVRCYGVGWCVQAGDAAALAATLRRALAERGDPALRARLEAAAEDLDWSRERLRLTGLYASLSVGMAG
jgi:glycosyltransferase involved in cell wall biosynthesis